MNKRQLAELITLGYTNGTEAFSYVLPVAIKEKTYMVTIDNDILRLGLVDKVEEHLKDLPSEIESFDVMSSQVASIAMADGSTKSMFQEDMTAYKITTYK